MLGILYAVCKVYALCPCKDSLSWLTIVHEEREQRFEKFKNKALEVVAKHGIV